MKTIRHYIEYFPIWVIYKISRLMSFSRVSGWGAAVGRFVGRIYPHVNQVADINIQRAFPDLDPMQRKKIIQGACENFGRTFFEYFVLDKAINDKNYRFSFANLDKVLVHMQEKRPLLFVSAHIANWEIGALELHRIGFPLLPIYRHINNPLLDRLILRCRSFYVDGQIPKGTNAGFRCLKAIKQGHRLVFLGDQKYGQGPEIPFFGHPAHTADGFVKLAQVTGCLIVPIHLVRETDGDSKGVHFIAHTDEDPIDPSAYNNDTDAILTIINQYFERWIRDHPDHWFWFHRRWDKSFYKEKRDDDGKLMKREIT